MIRDEDLRAGLLDGEAPKESPPSPPSPPVNKDDPSSPAPTKDVTNHQTTNWVILYTLLTAPVYVYHMVTATYSCWTISHLLAVGFLLIVMIPTSKTLPRLWRQIGALEASEPPASMPLVGTNAGNGEGPTSEPKMRTKKIFHGNPTKGVCVAALWSILYVLYLAEVSYIGGILDAVASIMRNEQELRQQQHHHQQLLRTGDPRDRRQRIVILAGPFQTDSVSIQYFLYRKAGQSVWLDPANEPPKPKRQHPSFSGWSWPVPVPEEFHDPRWDNDHHTKNKNRAVGAKFYGALVEYMHGYHRPQHYQESGGTATAEERLAMNAAYYRELLAVPWAEGKNLVIGSERMSSLVRGLAKGRDSDDGQRSSLDEHIDPRSGRSINKLMSLLPWKASSDLPTLQFADIEVHINYRTPRIENAIAFWRQFGKDQTLREFFASNASKLHSINALGLALQFVHKGINVTLVDMAGADAFGGFNWYSDIWDYDEYHPKGARVLACDILRIGNEFSPEARHGYCDSKTGRLHLPGYGTEKAAQAAQRGSRPDPRPRDLTELELERLGAAMERYDCEVWKLLQQFKPEGLVTVLYQREDLLAGCDLRGIDRFTYADMMREMEGIANNREGTPAETTSNQHGHP